MAKKKPRVGVPLHIWIDSKLRDAIEKSRVRNRRSLREEVSIALERYLAECGLWSSEEEEEQE